MKYGFLRYLGIIILLAVLGIIGYKTFFPDGIKNKLKEYEISSGQTENITNEDNTEKKVKYLNNIEWVPVVDDNTTYPFKQDGNTWKSTNANINDSASVQKWTIEIPDGIPYVEYTASIDVASAAWEDYFTLFFDDKEVYTVDVTSATYKQSLNLSPGSHTLTAEYKKDLTVSESDDAAYITLPPITVEQLNDAYSKVADAFLWVVSDSDAEYYFVPDGYKWYPNNILQQELTARTEYSITVDRDCSAEIRYFCWTNDYLLSSGNILSLELDGVNILTTSNVVKENEHGEQNIQSIKVDLIPGTHRLIATYSTDDHSPVVDETFLELKPAR